MSSCRRGRIDLKIPFTQLFAVGSRIRPGLVLLAADISGVVFRVLRDVPALSFERDDVAGVKVGGFIDCAAFLHGDGVVVHVPGLPGDAVLPRFGADLD